jgi:allantoin racemase
VRILVVNPNTTASMTETMRQGAQRYARPGTEIVAVEPTWGPESIEGFFEGFLSAAAVLERLATYPDPVDAVVLAGYGEPGLQGALELMDAPVIDVTAASAHMACLVAHRFGVVTTLHRCIPQIEEALGSVGLLGRCAGIRASGLAVLEIEEDEERTMAAMIAEGRRAVEDDRAEAICLGCGGMSGLDKRMEAELGVPVIDGLVAAVKLAEGLVDYGLATSRALAFERPRPKAIPGWPRPVPGAKT